MSWLFDKSNVLLELRKVVALGIDKGGAGPMDDGRGDCGNQVTRKHDSVGSKSSNSDLATLALGGREPSNKSQDQTRSLLPGHHVPQGSDGRSNDVTAGSKTGLGGNAQDDVPGDKERSQTEIHAGESFNNGGSTTKQKHQSHDSVCSKAKEQENLVRIAFPTGVDNLTHSVGRRSNLLEGDGEHTKQEHSMVAPAACCRAQKNQCREKKVRERGAMNNGESNDQASNLDV
jgi:hypothetical protein